ncbi:MAG: hypothetical protein H7Z19_22115, partial [Chitinophagaceae bacterium]|nr:hypothetical protein [Rubrivivax sp.]
MLSIESLSVVTLGRLWRALRLVLAMGAPLLAAAAPIPFAGREVQLTAREQPVAQFLADLFGTVDLPVVVSDRVRGAVNGSFRGDASHVWNNLARSFNLVAYFDGTVVHVYTPAELGTRTLPMKPEMSARVRRNAQDLGMLDSRNTLRSTAEGTLVASGTRRFIEQVDELVRGQIAGAAARPPQGFEVHFLRYAWAHDVSVGFGGRQVVVPGVASIIRALLTGDAQSRVQVVLNEQISPPTVPKLRGQGLMGRGNPAAGAAAGATANGVGATAANDAVATLLAAYAA